MNEAQTFLDALWGRAPAGAAIQVWDKETKKTSTFPSGEPELAANWAVVKGKHTDIYVAAGLGPRVEKPVKRRANANAVIGIPGLWADIDVTGGPEAKKGAAPDRDAALKLAHELLEPTIIVNSGYGLQAWWLFEEPWIFGFEAEREQAARMSAGFQAALKARAASAGFDIDSTFDLARLMRLPGTFNHKGSAPAPVEIIVGDGPTYELEEISAVAADYMSSAAAAALKTLAGSDVAIELRDTPPAETMMKLDELREIDTDFAAAWAHKGGTKTKDWSMSQWDLSIANYCAGGGFTDQEVAEVLIYHRKRYGDPGGKSQRVDYLQRTIAKARGASALEEAEAEEEMEREDSIDQLARVSRDAASPPSVTISLFGRVLGGPEVKELVQHGRDPDRARFVIHLADGREVALGGIDALTSQTKFRNSFAVVTGHLAKRVKAEKWDSVVQALLNAATVNEDDDDTRVAMILSWIDGYVGHGISTDRDMAALQADPFEFDGYVWVHIPSFITWLRRVKQERLPEPDVKLLIKEAGFEHRRVNHPKPQGEGRTQRSYWRLPKSMLERQPVAED
jgi:hypothetical protein